MRRAAKVDANHAGIVKALRQAGANVLDLSAVGKGCPDLLVTCVCYPHQMVLMEIKDGSKPPSARKLTPDQEKFHATWPVDIYTVTNIDEALAVVT